MASVRFSAVPLLLLLALLTATLAAPQRRRFETLIQSRRAAHRLRPGRINEAIATPAIRKPQDADATSEAAVTAASTGASEPSGAIEASVTSAEDVTTEATDADGATTTLNADGATETTEADGATETTEADGGNGATETDGSTEVSVTNSTAIEITTVKMSFSTEMSPFSETEPTDAPAAEVNVTETESPVTEPTEEHLTGNEVEVDADGLEQENAVTDDDDDEENEITTDSSSTSGPLRKSSEQSWEEFFNEANIFPTEGASSSPAFPSSDENMESTRTVSGTLIFDLGASASQELHDLVQQSVLEALFDEGLLASADIAAPIGKITLEGSGVVFPDEMEGSGSGLEADGSGDIALEDIAPFVSIHF